MDLTHALLLIVAGVAGGTISSLVGGAALVTYPALLAVGLPPVTATVCNLVALSPGNLLAALYDRTQLPPLNRSFMGLVIASVLGALAGAFVLLRTPERTFEVLVPLLLGFATLL
ncbi:MAG: TSUP family transporter, partial [Xanthobacteraceae bacterium]